jgi:asparagine synthetase B (glutamine-hydrolysing)
LWDEDLSGPFVVLKIDKATSDIEIITDLMSFIPVYEARRNYGRVLGTHVDMVARASESGQLDPVSLVDFIWNGVVTYPHTVYSGVFQLPPASSLVFSESRERYDAKPYWRPIEKNRYSSLEEAAEELRAGIQSYIDRACEGVERVACFLSGGEDSRTVLAMLPRACHRNAYIFLDRVNREGKVAEAAARLYGAAFKVETRSPEHYLNVLPACADLVGMGAEYSNVHTYGLEATAELASHRRVFGGFLSDAFLKGHNIKKDPGRNKFPFYEERKDTRYRRNLPDQEVFDAATVAALRERISAHMETLNTLRNESADEWFNLWPISMGRARPHLWGNRRLFSSYEPFTSTACVKVAAAVPQEWKLNRRLFHKMAKPVLYRSRHLIHADGWLPYQPWQVNRFVRPVIGFSRRVQRRFGLSTGNQGPWHDWQELEQTEAWKEFEKKVVSNAWAVSAILRLPVDRILTEKRLSVRQRVLLFQVVYQIERMISGPTVHF